jgi:uncharacterized protein
MADIYLYEFRRAVSDLIGTESVRSMRGFTQHADISCLEHCLFVSYIAYIFCRALKLDADSAARGGLLHDFFLYDWHEKSIREGLREGLMSMHGFTHPEAALKNALERFALTDMEQDIISCHMWPLTLKLPRYRESLIVCFSDKFCTVMEVTRLYKLLKLSHIMRLSRKGFAHLG